MLIESKGFSHCRLRTSATRNIIPRPGLTDYLNDCLQYPLVLVSAPAGYGKTTLVRAWAKNAELPVIWLSLDENADDIQLFIRYLIEAFRNHRPGMFNVTSALVTGLNSPSFEVISKSLVCEICELEEEFILVLDNYEYIHEKQIDELLTSIIELAAAKLHLVVLTRREPPLPIANLRARHLLGELHARDLQFIPPETEALFESIAHGRRDNTVIENTVSEMEGWVAGLLLSMSVLETSNGAYKVIHAKYVNEYLGAEIFSRIDPLYLELLCRASIPDRLCAGLCNALFQGTGAQVTGIGFLKWMEQENLFISIEGEPGWYRLHPAFRTALCTRLEDCHTVEEIEHLHEVAADWLIHHGCVEAALPHARLVRPETAFQLFRESRLTLLEIGNWQVLEKWLALLPERLIGSELEVLYAEAWLNLAYLRISEAATILNRIEILLSASGNSPAESIERTEFNVLKATYFLRTGNITGALEYSRQATNELGIAHFLKAMAVKVCAGSYCLQGDLSSCLNLLSESLVFAGATANTLFSLRVRSSLCQLLLVMVHLADVEKTADLMLKISRDSKYMRFTGLANLYLGIVAYQKNELLKAEHHLAAAVEHTLFMDADEIMTAFIGLAATELAMGQPGKTRSTIDALKSYLFSISNFSLLAQVENFEVELMLRQGKEIINSPNGATEQINVPSYLFQLFHHPVLTRCRQLIQGKNQESQLQAISLLENLHRDSVAAGNDMLRLAVMAQSAFAQYACGNREEALGMLARALKIAETGGCLRVFLDLGTPMAGLFQHSKFQREGFVQDILEAFMREVPVMTPRSTRILVEQLTEQELRVLGFLRQRLSNKEIADELSITPTTVKSHTIHIYQKLDVANRREAVEKASSLGILYI